MDVPQWNGERSGQDRRRSGQASTALHNTPSFATQHGKLVHRWGWAGAEVDDRRSRGTSGSRSVRSLFFSVNFVTCRMSEHADELPQSPRPQQNGRSRTRAETDYMEMSRSVLAAVSVSCVLTPNLQPRHH